jgi:hypothetical protein
MELRNPSPSIRSGNAADEGAPYNGWFLGPFLDPGHPGRTAHVEVKWRAHAAGQTRGARGRSPWTTLSVLVQGRFRLEFDTGDVVLGRPGDYALWLPHVDHAWTAEEASIVLTVRWPQQV